MRRYNITPKAGSEEFPSTPLLDITEADNGEWIRYEDVPSKTMADRHWEIARKRANDEKERADKYEEFLIAINKIIYANPSQPALGDDNYFTIRGMCAEAARAKDEREKG